VILGFAHPAIVVRDLERAARFYGEAFGFRRLGSDLENWQDNPDIDAAIGCEGSAVNGCMLAGHNCYLELFEFTAPKQQGPAPEILGPHELGIRHIAFYVDDVSAEYERVLGLGASPLGVPRPEAGITAVYLRDPDGNVIELAEFPTPEEDLRHLPGVSCLQSEVAHV
jgi:catechol 2,3-dioxygenase-like lactoylglutathione lyase family enzyme